VFVEPVDLVGEPDHGIVAAPWGAAGNGWLAVGRLEGGGKALEYSAQVTRGCGPGRGSAPDQESADNRDA
jgi:hypothetical protein